MVKENKLMYQKLLGSAFHGTELLHYQCQHFQSRHTARNDTYSKSSFIMRKLHSCNPIHKRGKSIINILHWISGWLHLSFSISSSSVQVANTLQQIVAISYKPVIRKEICTTSSTNYNVTSNLQSKFSHWDAHRKMTEYSPSFD